MATLLELLILRATFIGLRVQSRQPHSIIPVYWFDPLRF
jgi:hypothetical protein